ncbi:M24 family metallopeptidase (plasmid) [Haloarcula marismortui]|uniref:M24 family metallopeptidase n=1 Tax=Haloarcula marismortui TaxID=2238 RepID=UPI003C777247
MGTTSVPTREFESRLGNVREKLSAVEADGLCLFSAVNIHWLTGFDHLQTERPVCLLVTQDAVQITVPRLERDHAASDQFPVIETVHNYYDYPGGTTDSTTYYQHSQLTPEAAISEMLEEAAVEAVVADSDGAPAYWGYQGPALSDFADVAVEPVDWIRDFRTRKSPVERDLLRESATWGNLAHRALEGYIEPGRHELWPAKKASLDASMAMLDALGPEYDSHLRGDFPAAAGFLSGPNTALPHGLTENRRLERGDILITYATSNVGGYMTELERTMFVGEVSDTHRHHFEQMLEMQTLAIERCGPGVPVCEVDQAVHDYCNEQGLLDYTQHHTGHNIGLEGHERDFIDRGSEVTMQPGHVYTIEPALFVPDVGGYRHSDTVLITEDGVERLTYYPRDLESNVITC